MKTQLLQRIQDRTAVVGIIGLGYVGLPLAVEFAKAGFHVIGYDVSERVCKLLMSGKSHIQDVPDADIATLVRSGSFEATTVESRLGEADAISVAVPTPLSKTRDPDMSFVIAATDAMTRQVRAGVLVVLQFTLVVVCAVGGVIEAAAIEATKTFAAGAGTIRGCIRISTTIHDKPVEFGVHWLTTPIPSARTTS